jgi:hypothetical protein
MTPKASEYLLQYHILPVGYTESGTKGIFSSAAVPNKLAVESVSATASLFPGNRIQLPEKAALKLPERHRQHSPEKLRLPQIRPTRLFFSAFGEISGFDIRTLYERLGQLVYIALSRILEATRSPP